jgi:hypothetical protein
MLNSERLAKLFQHILATAALNEDFTQRQLGPIHFVKYAYLADLAYAARNGGQSFTGADWRFYHFGPWSDEVFSQIEPVLAHLGAQRWQVASKYADDFVRYGLRTDEAKDLASDAENALPFTVSSAVAKAVHEHGTDTADLLRHVYLTGPMLSARPGENLDLSTVVKPKEESVAEVGQTPSLTKSQQKARAALIERTRQEMAKRFVNRTVGKPPMPPPRYDEVFAEGTAKLDEMAGPSSEKTTGELRFDDSIWSSDQRREPTIP